MLLTDIYILNFEIAVLHYAYAYHFLPLYLYVQLSGTLCCSFQVVKGCRSIVLVLEGLRPVLELGPILVNIARSKV